MQISQFNLLSLAAGFPLHRAKQKRRATFRALQLSNLCIVHGSNYTLLQWNQKYFHILLIPFLDIMSKTI
jgi:hypothetical protein